MKKPPRYAAAPLMAPAGSSATDRAPGTPESTAAVSAAAEGALTEKETTNKLVSVCKTRGAGTSVPAAASSARAADVGQSLASTAGTEVKPIMSAGSVASAADTSVALTLKSTEADDAHAQARKVESIVASGVFGASIAAANDAYGKPVNCRVSKNDAEPSGGTYAASAAEVVTPEGSGVALGVCVASVVWDELGREPRDSDAELVTLV